jgi:outer membrane murein-binding lipoprotein Lpp
MRAHITLALSMVVLIGITAAGCGDGGKKKVQRDSAKTPKGSEQAGADSHDAPLTDAEIGKLKNELNTYDTAVKRIKSYRDTIREKIAAEQPAQAHRALDELDLALDWLSGIAKDSGVPKERWEEVSTSAQTLRDSFNELHAAIDAGREPNYQAVASTIDAAVTKLDAVAVDAK